MGLTWASQKYLFWFCNLWDILIEVVHMQTGLMRENLGCLLICGVKSQEFILAISLQLSSGVHVAWDQQRAESLNSEDLLRSGAPAPCPEWRDMGGQQALQAPFWLKRQHLLNI